MTEVTLTDAADSIRRRNSFRRTNSERESFDRRSRSGSADSDGAFELDRAWTIERGETFEISPQLLASVRASSSFSLFQQQAALLRRPEVGRWITDRRARTDGERLMFLMNLWNLMMLHGLVVKPNPGSGEWFCDLAIEHPHDSPPNADARMHAPPATFQHPPVTSYRATGNRAAGLLYRARFNASVRYGVGEMVLDLNEIEHALLRINLFGISYSYIGNVGRQVRPFPPEDPRSKMALRSPPANITFGLCCVTATAPPLFVFKDPVLVYTHLDLLAANYLGKVQLWS